MFKNSKYFFNTSHSSKYALCVISDREVGCDIEEIKEYKEQTGKYDEQKLWDLFNKEYDDIFKNEDKNEKPKKLGIKSIPHPKRKKNKGDCFISGKKKKEI